MKKYELRIAVSPETPYYFELEGKQLTIEAFSKLPEEEIRAVQLPLGQIGKKIVLTDPREITIRVVEMPDNPQEERRILAEERCHLYLRAVWIDSSVTITLCGVAISLEEGFPEPFLTSPSWTNDMPGHNEILEGIARIMESLDIKDFEGWMIETKLPRL